MMTPCMFPIGAMHQLSESILAHLSQNWTLWRTSSMWKEITLQSDDGYNEHLVSNKIHLFLVSSYEILMTSSNGNIFRVTGPLCGKTSPSPHKGQLRGTLVFSLICAWTNRWANNRDDSDLRRHRAHYDANVMYKGNQLAFVPCTKQYHKQKRHLKNSDFHTVLSKEYFSRLERYYPIDNISLHHANRFQTATLCILLMFGNYPLLVRTWDSNRAL